VKLQNNKKTTQKTHLNWVDSQIMLQWTKDWNDFVERTIGKKRPLERKEKKKKSTNINF